MQKISKSLVFFGSGPVAAKSLSLLSREFTIEAVITKPRAVNHKGSVPVLELAGKLGIKIYTADSKSKLDELFGKDLINSKLGVLIDFGIIVSKKVIDYFELGIINSHFSLLPEWRGADPITFAILSGQEKTGVSLMLLAEAMDEGPLLAYGEYEITPNTSSPELTSQLIDLSHALLVETIPLYIDGKLEPTAQDITGKTVSYSRKLTKDDGLIDWRKPAAEIEREVRAFIEWPKSRTKLGEVDIIIKKAKFADIEPGRAGKLKISGKHLFVYCSEGALEILELQPANKPVMSVESFLAGYGKKLA